MTTDASLSWEGRVLLLPATRRDGEAIFAILQAEAIETLVCSSPSQFIGELELGAATLVLTDAALTGPSGRQIIATLGRQPAWSDVPVIVLGRETTSPEAAGLIGRMTNVTLLERPTSLRTLLSAIRTSLRARERQYQMRDQVAALRDAENALRLSDRRKDEFLAMLAHELRNPLAPIRTASELLPRIVPPGDERVDTTLQVVRRQVRQLARLVDDLLDVSRITQGRIELQREIVDLGSVMAQALETVEPLMKEKRHTVLREAHWPVIQVRGDRARLVQCLANILTNAAKYTDHGGRVHVGLQQRGDMAVMWVQDNGLGIPPDLLPTIFDLFVQSERSLDRAQGGLGIGLSVVRQLVEMHDGTVTAHSEGEGKGSTFEICLPRVAVTPDTVPVCHPANSPQKRILIVDDNRDAADSISLLLKDYGHEVRTAYAGEEALAMASSFPADVVLLDIGLPGMNGYEVARQLRSRAVTARLVALTGYGQPEDVKRASEAGFDAHMVKPVDFDLVLEELSS
jgi:signal transduction histidine kinase